MKPAQPPLHPPIATPTPPSRTPLAPTQLARGVPVRTVALWLPLLAVACAALLASYLAGYLGATPAAAAALAAAFGVVLVALPLAHLVRRMIALPAQAPALPAGRHGFAEPDGAFLDRASRELARARRYGSGAALLLVDVDRGGRLADPEVGGTVEAALASLLRQTEPSLRSADLVTRFSGSQLAVLLSPADATGALDVAERIRERAEQLNVPPGGRASASSAVAAPLHPHVTVSIGVAVMRPTPIDLASMIDEATEALAAARQAGGNCVRTAAPGHGRLHLPGSRDDRRAQRK